MNRTDNPTHILSADNQADETRMRRTLGLQGGAVALPHQQRPEQARQRHRFAQDGSVPVVMLNRSGDTETGAAKGHVAALETALEAERTAHAATRRTLHEAQTAHQALQTRLAHAELAHGEALAAERQARKHAEDALEAALTAPKPGPMRVELPFERPARKLRVNAAAPREPKPVRWWTPSYRAERS